MARPNPDVLAADSQPPRVTEVKRARRKKATASPHRRSRSSPSSTDESRAAGKILAPSSVLWSQRRGPQEEREMTYRKRKSIRAAILALATAAILVPAAQAHTDFRSGSQSASGYSPQALKALSERYTKMAEA